MKENEIIFQVSQIVSATGSFYGAVAKIRCMIELTIHLPGRASQVEKPSSNLYAAPIAGGRQRNWGSCWSRPTCRGAFQTTLANSLECCWSEPA